MIVDRSEGGGSIQDGSIEVMVHRRTLYDDSLGVGEPLNETAFGEGLVVRGKHVLILESPLLRKSCHLYVVKQTSTCSLKHTFKEAKNRMFTPARSVLRRSQGPTLTRKVWEASLGCR